MSAIEETDAAAAAAGKSTRLSLGEATRLTLPQLPYGDAVHAALAELEFLPDTLDVGVRTETIERPHRELFLRLEWLPGNEGLIPQAVRADGLILQWSHLAGWSLRTGDDLVDLVRLAELADPAVVADVAMHAGLYGVRSIGERPATGARWSEADHLDSALVQYDERLVIW
ncbi:hypothetical protein [Streptomyces sp. NPDC050535]|uniref:hypothetical protein n=1 Tax=Streptomyces sp. NPDC050535 TaxID=3365626 RepID=UPI0037A70C9D